MTAESTLFLILGSTCVVVVIFRLSDSQVCGSGRRFITLQPVSSGFKQIYMTYRILVVMCKWREVRDWSSSSLHFRIVPLY